MTLGKLLSLSWTQFPDTNPFHRVASSLDERIHVKHLEQCLAHGKCPARISYIFTHHSLSSQRLHSHYFIKQNFYVLSTELVLGMGEGDKGTELLYIGRTQFILWFPSGETGLVLNNIICVKCLKMLGRKTKYNLKGCWEFSIFELSIVFSPVPFSILCVSGAAHIAVNFTILTEFGVNAKCCLDGLSCWEWWLTK